MGTNNSTERWTLVFTVNIKGLFLFFFFFFFSQSFADREYVTWQTENDQFTREACDALLKQLKKQHLDPILDQLHGKEGAKVMFDDIVAGYKKIEQDYKARATGAKQVCAAVFFEFHPVNRVLIGIKNSDQKWDKLMG